MTKLKSSDILDLPDAPDFISKPPAYTAGEMIQICEKMLPHWNKIRFSNPPPPFIGEPFQWDDNLKALQQSGKKSGNSDA